MAGTLATERGYALEPSSEQKRAMANEVVDYLVDTGEGEIRVRTKPELDFRIGQQVHVGVSPQKCVALPS